ncbi:MAG: preprotein translocase subunit SecE [Myxococcales bacterium]|nr:preprotein translocase subunit SecE [Myxococcales bacterium]
MFNKIKTFLKEVRIELKKVSWPNREVTVASTWVVIAVCFVFAVYFFVVDVLIGKIITGFLNL